MKKFSEFIADHPKLVAIISILLLIPSLIGFINTRTNYDILSYLPQDLDSTKGQNLLDDVYGDAATGIVIVEGMEEKDIKAVKEKINKIDGVNTTIGTSDILDESIPKDILPEKIKDQLYNGDNTMFLIKFDESQASDKTLSAVEETRKVLNKQCFLSGMSSIVRDTKDIADGEAPFYVIVAVLLSIVVLVLSMKSTLVPVIFMLSIGMGILYNMGTNIIFGEISYITKALAAVLQLGVTMDYSIFLMNRYDEELGKYDKKEKAMASAIQATMLSISGSSLTTIAGFVALCAMTLTLGKDIGLVMCKGVIIGVICSVTVLPSLVLIFDKAIHRFKHRTIIPKFDKLSYVVTHHSRIVIITFLILIIPSLIGYEKTQVYYNLDQSLPKDAPSRIATDKMREELSMMTMHFVIVKDSVPTYQVSDMVKKIEKVDGVTSVICYDDIVGPSIPENFIPDNIKEIFKQGGYNMFIVGSEYASASDQENKQIDEVNGIVKDYDSDALVTGEGVLTKDLTEISDVDFKNVSIVSIFAIFIIILIVFKSISVPVLLVVAIEFAILMNMGIPYYTGTVIPFIASIVIGTIQLGATVDYAILMTSRFKEELGNGHPKKEAMEIAVRESAKSIVTSGLTFFGATGGVALVSDMPLISSLCFLLARGAIISMLVILLILPSLLLVFEGIISKTSLKWKPKNNVKA